MVSARPAAIPWSFRARDAADVVPEIRAILEKTYEKKVRRHKPTVVEIAAHIFGVAVRNVELALGRDKLKRHKKRKSGQRETVSS